MPKRRVRSGDIVSLEKGASITATFYDEEGERHSHLLEECTLICWKCGCLTFYTKESFGKHRGPICSNCLTEWPRAFKMCPVCGSFIHMNPPTRWELEEIEHPVNGKELTRFIEAIGTAYCDGCAVPWAYRWEAPSKTSETAILDLLGFDFDGYAVKYSYKDADVIQDS